MLELLYNNTLNYIFQHPKSIRKEKGQFFTSLNVAKYMAKSMNIQPSFFISILDPGAGSGILSAAVIEYLVSEKLCSKIRTVFYETDSAVQPILEQNINIIRDYCENHSINFESENNRKDFITSESIEKFDIVICNPPYKKIRKDSEESQAMHSFVYGQPNLYGLFMAKAVNLLKPEGKYTFIVPRSWTSGTYFQKIRQHIFSHLSIEKLHIFEDREKAFSNEQVLQETMILWATKTDHQAEMISIFVSYDDSLSDSLHIISSADTFLPADGNGCMYIPSNQHELDVLIKMHHLADSFDSLGYVFKTGPVVEFRSIEDISVFPTEDKRIPMFRSTNISESGFVFPVYNGKAQYVSQNAQKLLIPNENTVLVRRLSAKEETKRLHSCIYTRQGDTHSISIENHVNYLARKDGKPLKQAEVEWVHSILSSNEYDLFFRMLNGSTQVNASDLNTLPVRRYMV